MVVLGIFITVMMATVCVMLLLKRVKMGWPYVLERKNKGDIGESINVEESQEKTNDSSADTLVFEELSYDGRQTGKYYEVKVSDKFSVVGRNELGGTDIAISRSHMNINKKNGYITIIPEKIECPVHIVDHHLNITDSMTNAFVLKEDGIIKLGRTYFRVYTTGRVSDSNKTVIDISVPIREKDNMKCKTKANETKIYRGA